MTRTTQRPSWLGGLVVGAVAGFLSLELPLVGWVLFVAFAAVALLAGPRLAGLGGLLIGTGTIVLALVTVADARCRQSNGPGEGCTPPDMTPWLVIGLAMAVAGVILSLVAAVRGR
jgi:uncharacterized membrane protein